MYPFPSVLVMFFFQGFMGKVCVTFPVQGIKAKIKKTSGDLVLGIILHYIWTWTLLGVTGVLLEAIILTVFVWRHIWKHILSDSDIYFTVQKLFLIISCLGWLKTRMSFPVNGVKLLITSDYIVHKFWKMQIYKIQSNTVWTTLSPLDNRSGNLQQT